MANDQTVAPVIIKRKKIIAADGHHGGAWKVAYADFVTAMMAFFMLMWLLNATTEQQKKGIADYFSPTLAINRSSGGGDSSFVGDTVLTEETLTRQGVGASTIYPTESAGSRGATGLDDDGSEESKVFQEITENATAQTEAARASIDTTLSEIETVDVAERAAELKQLEAQLEKVYLLTAQIQNQDPMNPIDSSDYATQLATFSSVEQQVLANSYLENIQSALSSSSLASVANWIGKSAKVEGKLWFDGDPVKLEFELPLTPHGRSWLFKHRQEMKFSAPMWTPKIAHCIGQGHNRTARMSSMDHTKRF